MTSATIKPARGAGGGYAEGRGLGLIIFAAVMLAVVGFFNLLDGIAAIAQSHIFIGNAHYVVGDLRAWGWVMTIFGAVQLLVAVGVWAGNQLARWLPAHTPSTASSWTAPNMVMTQPQMRRSPTT